MNFDREKNGKRLTLGGINTLNPPDALPKGKFPYLQNVRRYLERIVGRATQSASVVTLDAPPVAIARLNDTTPAGPAAGYTLIAASSAGSVYASATQVATGLSGNAPSLLPFRPNTSVQPWMYMGDSAPYPNVTVEGGFACAGMIKVRSDGLSRKTGIAEPQQAPTVTFPGGGSGPAQIFYYFTYYASETGAESNPSPVSIPGTNSQSNPSATENAATGGTINPNYTVNAAQYEGNGSQIRTTGSVVSGTITSPIVATGFGPSLAIPTGVNVDGITGDLNWQGQNSGTGVLSEASLYYLGTPIGSPKFPATQNQPFATDTLVGGSNDTWGASLSPAIVNDPSFGIGWTITAQSSGGSTRSFINYTKIIASYSTQDAQVTAPPSPDPQVNKINFYRQGGGLANPTFVGQGPNSSTVFNDLLSDLGAATNRELVFSNFEPFPSIDLPRSGTLNAASQVLTWVSGDHFNVRWLPGTVILIGSPSQVAYTAVRRPGSTTAWDFTNNDPTVPTIPNGTNLVWNISEPGLAAQPLPSVWGPTDNTAYMFGCGDPDRPGTLYFTQGNNPDAAPDTNQIEVTSPSEPLMNGTIVNGIAMVWSTERRWMIYPTFTTALATVEGVSGQPFNLILASAIRGLYIRPCICTDGGNRSFFRGKDGLYATQGLGPDVPLTDADLFNLFPHEGVVPQTLTIAGFTIVPPNDSLPEQQSLSYANGYLYYDYVGIDSSRHTLVLDVAAKGFVVDVYQYPVTVHALEVGPGVNGTLVGCSDSTIRNLVGNGGETAISVVLTPADDMGDARAQKQIGDVFIRALVESSQPITVSLFQDQYETPVTGYSPAVLVGVGDLEPYIIDFGVGGTDGGQYLVDIAMGLSWNTASGNQLDLWQPDWIPQPEAIQDRPSDWMDLKEAKFIQGYSIMADSFGNAKTFSIQSGDDLSIHSLNEIPSAGVVFNGQTRKVFSCVPFVAHTIRRIAGDGVQWRVWEEEPIFQPFPEMQLLWQTELSDMGGQGWQHISAINLAYIATAPITLTLSVDDGSDAYGPPPLIFSSSTQGKVYQKFAPNKWKLLGFTVSSSVPFALFLPDIEVWVKSWGVDAQYRKLKPFGGPASGKAAV